MNGNNGNLPLSAGYLPNNVSLREFGSVSLLPDISGRESFCSAPSFDFKRIGGLLVDDWLPLNLGLPYYRDEYVTLYQGNSLELLAQLPAACVDLILTDPPYGMSWQSGRRKKGYAKIANDESLEWLNSCVAEWKRILRPDRHIYSFCSWHHIETFKIEIQKQFDLLNMLIWVKNNHGSGNLAESYAPQHELILYGQTGRRKRIGKRISDVLSCPKASNSKHPTVKPLDLIETLISKSAYPGELVIDPFGGSGTTGVACKRLGRKCILVELDKTYCAVAAERLRNTTVPGGRSLPEFGIQLVA